MRRRCDKWQTRKRGMRRLPALVGTIARRFVWETDHESEYFRFRCRRCRQRPTASPRRDKLEPQLISYSVAPTQRLNPSRLTNIGLSCGPVSARPPEQARALTALSLEISAYTFNFQLDGRQERNKSMSPSEIRE